MSRRGGHLWIFLATPLLARECRVYIHDLALRLGVPVKGAGLADNPKIGYAKSIVDYIFRWLELKFITGEQGELFKALPVTIPATMPSDGSDPVEALGALVQIGDAPACNICGSLMVRSGTCYRCGTCGSTSGCS